MSVRLEYACNLRPFRQYSTTQQALILEVQNNDYSIDKITTFGLRAPELLFVAYIILYLSWFTFYPIKVTESNAHILLNKYVNIPDISHAYWVDGANRIVRVRKQAIPRLYDYTRSVLRGEHGLYHDKLDHYYYQVIKPLFEDPSRFPNLVDFVQTIPPIIVPPLTLPAASGKWLVHLALYYGRYTTESELFGTSSLVRTYEICGLLSPDDPEESVIELLDIWARSELRTMPGSHRCFSRNLAIAKYVLHTFMCTNSGGIVYVETPLITLRQIEAAHTDELDDFITKSRKRFIDAVLRLEIPNMPSAEALLGCTLGSPLSWIPSISPCVGQSPASVSEQRYVLRSCVDTINYFRSTSSVFVPYILLVGCPGSGKTTLCMLSAMFARSRGLEVTTSALSSERSLLLGGFHLHNLFGVGVNKGGRLVTASEIAYSAVRKLRGNGLKLSFLLSLDVILIDECGLIDQCLFTALSDILCTLRKVKTPYGGVLLLLTGDPFQLSQITGRSLWVSPFMHSLFNVYELQEQVRAAQDPTLQRCINILRDPTYPVSEEGKNYLCEALIANCNLVSSIELVRDEFGFTSFEVYSKRCSEQAALTAFNNHLRRRELHGDHIYTSIAEDELNEGGLHSTWKPATLMMSKKLDKYCSEPYELKLAVGLILRFTRNGLSADGTVNYSQGQLGICTGIPDGNRAGTVGILVAPVGIQFANNIDVSNPPSDWLSVRISRDVGYDIIVEAVTMKRRQYPLKNHVSCTIHKALGLTVPQLTTRLATPSSDERFALWEKQQLLVVISRVKRLADITLINTPNEIRDTIGYLLQKRSSDMTTMAHLLKAVAKTCPSSDPTRIVIGNFESASIRVCDPNMECGGYVYCLCSSKRVNSSYIGSTSDIYQRLNSHNRGLKGASFTAINDLMPWRIAALIVGFPFHARNDSYNKSCRAEVEHAWHILVEPSDTLPIVLSKGKTLLHAFRSKYPHLKFIDYYVKSDTDV